MHARGVHIFRCVICGKCLNHRCESWSILLYAVALVKSVIFESSWDSLWRSLQILSLARILHHSMRLTGLFVRVLSLFSWNQKIHAVTQGFIGASWFGIISFCIRHNFQEKNVFTYFSFYKSYIRIYFNFICGKSNCKWKGSRLLCKNAPVTFAMHNIHTKFNRL